MNIKSYIAASVVASISISVSSVAMAGDTYYAAKDCPKSSNVIDRYGFYKCYCTSYVADKIATTSDSSFKNSSLSDALNWKNAAAKIGYTSETTPKAGDIAWWAPVPNTKLALGHVAYVEFVNADGTVNISEYNWNTTNGYGTRNNIKANAYLRKSSVSTKVTLSSVGVTCPSSVWDLDSSAGTCNATAYYSDKSNKSVKASSWGNSNSTAASINNGAISTKDVSKDATVKFTASYTEGTVTKTSSEASVVVKDLPDGTDPKGKCDSDATTIEYNVYNDPKKLKGLLGKVQLRYSPSCKAAWGRIDLTSKEKTMTVTSTTISTSRTGKSTYTSPLVSLKSTSYANIALLRVSGDQVCAIGTINGKSPTTTPCKKL